MNSLNTNPMDSALSKHSGEAWALKEWAEDLKYLDSMTQEHFKELLFNHATKDYFETKWDLFCSDKLRFILGIIHNLNLLQKIMYYIYWRKVVVE